MKAAAITATQENDSFGDPLGLMERAKSLEALLGSEAEKGEALGRLTDGTIAALYDAGLMRMWVPRQFGGAELWPVASLKVIEALCYADGSTGWVLMASQLSTSTGAAYTPLSTATELFGGDKLTVIAGHGAPLGRANIEKGGFRLTGNWSYASGIHHAQYIHTGGIVFDGGEPRIDPGTGEPEFRIFLVPVGAANLKENWDVLGLRATGSIDYSIEDVFVPEDFTHIQMQKTPNQGGDLYKLGIWAQGAIGHTGFALGTGRRLLDELAKLARMDGKRPMLLHTQGGGENFEVRYGEAEGKFRAARALVFEAWREMEAILPNDGPIPTRAYTLIRLALAHVTAVTNDIASLAFTYGGGGALRGGVMQRFVRDVMAGAQHATTGPLIIRQCAKDLMGMAEGKIWAVRSLVDPVK
ncbi:MAG: acyl-CoA dehydrogenase family protein [Rhodospirillales bacterium]|nr:acyl-CoA dehydrogenase family protein [Rhodospirillales bacterium]